LSKQDGARIAIIRLFMQHKTTAAAMDDVKDDVKDELIPQRLLPQAKVK